MINLRRLFYTLVSTFALVSVFIILILNHATNKIDLILQEYGCKADKISFSISNFKPVYIIHNLTFKNAIKIKTNISLDILNRTAKGYVFSLGLKGSESQNILSTILKDPIIIQYNLPLQRKLKVGNILDISNHKNIKADLIIKGNKLLKANYYTGKEAGFFSINTSHSKTYKIYLLNKDQSTYIRNKDMDIKIHRDEMIIDISNIDLSFLANITDNNLYHTKGNLSGTVEYSNNINIKGKCSNIVYQKYQALPTNIDLALALDQNQIRFKKLDITHQEHEINVRDTDLHIKNYDIKTISLLNSQIKYFYKKQKLLDIDNDKFTLNTTEAKGSGFIKLENSTLKINSNKINTSLINLSNTEIMINSLKKAIIKTNTPFHTIAGHINWEENLLFSGDMIFSSKGNEKLDIKLDGKTTFFYNYQNNFGKIDFTDLGINIPYNLGYKEPGEKNIALIDINSYTISLSGKQIIGQIVYSEDLNKINFMFNSYLPKMNMYGDGYFRLSDNFFKLEAKGTYIDVSGFVQDDSDSSSESIPLDIDIKTKKLNILEDGRVYKAHLSVQNKSKLSSPFIKIKAKTVRENNQEGDVNIMIKGKAPFKRLLIQSNNTGLLTKSLNIGVPIRQGENWIEGYINNNQASGIAYIANTYTTKPLGLLNLIQLFSVGHWLNMLLQPNKNFWHSIDCQWTYNFNNSLILEDFVMKNLHYIINSEGQIDMVNKEMEILGSLIPYSIWQRFFGIGSLGIGFRIFGDYTDPQVQTQNKTGIIPLFFIP